MQMRRFILKTKAQSAWAKSKEWIIVWSPCLALPTRKKKEAVPGRRQNHQDVRFCCTNDIERDSCTVYRRQIIETVPRLKHTHGVAIVDSQSHDFSYKRGDRFWLLVGQNPTDLSTLTAPVVNLTTMRQGNMRGKGNASRIDVRFENEYEDSCKYE